MTYKLAKFGFIMLAAAFLSSFLSFEIGIAAGIVFLIGGVFLCFVFKKRGMAKLFCFAAALGMLLVSAYLYKDYYPQRALGGLSAEITGRITEISSPGGRPVYTVKTDSVSIEGALQKISFKLSGWGGNESAEVYDKISCRVVFFSPQEDEISEFLENRSQKAVLYAYMDSPMEITGTYRRFPEYHLHLLREKISGIIRENYFGDNAAFTKKLLFGMGEAPDEIKTSFRSAGMNHILAVSGMHLVIIMGLLESLLFRKNMGPKSGAVKILIMMAATLCYTALCGFGMSVMRAGFMLTAGYIARLLWARSASIDNLGLAVITVLLIDPLAACDAGFLMSVLASGGIILFSGPLYEKLCGKIKLKRGRGFVLGIIKAFAVSVTAWCATLPVSVLFFGGASAVSPVSNIIAGPLAEGAVIFGILSVALGFLPFGGLCRGAAVLTQILEIALFKTAEFFASLPFSYFYLNEKWMKIWVIGAVLLVVIPLIKKENLRYLKHGILMAAFAFLCGALCQSLMYSGTVKTTVMPLKEGTAVCMEKEGSSVILAKGLCYDDCYKLRGDGMTADLFISLGADSAAAEAELMREYEPSVAMLSESGSLKKFEGSIPVSNGEIKFWEDASVRIISESAVEIDTGGILILYIFEECDIMDIEPRFRKADIIIQEGISPEDYTNLRCRYLILRERAGIFGGAEEVIVLHENEQSFISRGKNIKKGWTFG